MKWVDRWYTNSMTNPDKEYTVSRADDQETWGCSCPAWTFQRNRLNGGICKHIRLVKEATKNMNHEELIHSQNYFPEDFPANIRRDDFFTEEEFTL